MLGGGGWDLAKALKLMLNGNAVIIEWLTSPIVYRGDNTFRREFLDFAGVSASRQRIAQHYIHLGRNVIENKLGDLDDGPVGPNSGAKRCSAATPLFRSLPRWSVREVHTRTSPARIGALCFLLLGPGLPVRTAR